MKNETCKQEIIGGKVMKRYRLNLLLPLALAVLTLLTGSCVTVNIPPKEGQQPIMEKQPVINSFSVSPASITAGGSATLSWEVTGADRVNIDPGIGNVALSGSTAVSPSMATSYILTATNSSGSITAVAQVSVDAASPPGPDASLPVIDSFTANPESILLGGSSKLSWAVSNVTSVTISPDIGTALPAGNKNISPSTTTTYTLKATNAAGWRSKSITVTVTPIKSFNPVIPTITPFVQFEDKTWVLEKYGTTGSLQNVIAGKEVNAKFDSSTGKVSGSAGCNSYTATYTRSYNTLTVSGLSSTMMLCTTPAGIMQQESDFKNALSSAESCRLVNNKLEINCTMDRLLIFHPK